MAVNYQGEAFRRNIAAADDELHYMLRLFEDNHRTWTTAQLDDHYDEMVNLKMRCSRLNRTGIWHTKEQNEEKNKKARERIRNSLTLRLKYSVSSGIRHHIKKDGTTTDSILNDRLGYTITELIAHLESKFDDKMTWENYGSYWHIDHITPASWFKYESFDDPQFKECWSLDNLQPLEAKKNMSKGNRFAG